MRHAPAARQPGHVRLADLIVGLALVADLGMGREPDTSTRACIIATELARRLGLPETGIRDAYFTALLLHSGCTAYAHETARVFGDDIRLNAAGSRTHLARSTDLLATFVPGVMQPGAGPAAYASTLAKTLVQGGRFGRENNRAVCEAARHTAGRLGLPVGVQTGLYHGLEWWNGNGAPQGLSGEAIAPSARIARVADMAALFDSIGGSELARSAVRERRGTYLDPTVVDAFLARSDELLGAAHAGDPRATALEVEPTSVVRIHPADVRAVARAFGELVDLKSPFLHGHATDVARLSADTAARLGLGGPAVADLEVAALLHDVGRAAVPTTIWDKPGALTAAEWERVRLHSYHSERILAGSTALAPLAATAGRHHERLDRSGYHRGSGETDLTAAARILAAADVCAALTSERPHRPVVGPDAASEALAVEAAAGRLDPEIVAAVAEAAGQPSPRRSARPLPAGLTAREVEVLRLVAAGESNRAIAARLSISPRTAEHHVQGIYTKIGSSSRAAAALFAMEHDLLVPDG